MMYQAHIALPKKSAFEALQMLYSGKDITKYHDHIMRGSITYEESGDRTTLELDLIVAVAAAYKLVSIKTIPKKGSEDPSGLYPRLKEIYQSMRAQHGESITPLGIVGPSRHAEIIYYAVDANGLGDTTLKPIDISHICLN